MEEKRELAKQEYINTPFAYLKLQTGLSLLQQDIMTRVSAHLQKYFNEYWSDNELRFSKENPRTFLTDEQIENLGPIRINFSEIRISPDSYERLDEARNKIMDIKIKGLVETEEGKKDRKWNVFSYVDLPVTDSGTTVMKKDRKVDESGKVHKVGEAKKTETDRYRGYMEVYLDKDLIKHTFNMISGYVTHPEKIAQIGRVPNMPSMYYFVRHRMNNFRPDKDGKEITTATISIEDLREHLAMYIRDTKGEIIKVKYPKYSRFKSQVLTVILDEIKRCFDKGLIDAYFEMSEIRPRGKKTGEPTSIIFTKIDHTEDAEEIIEDPKAIELKDEPKAQQTELQFTDEEPQYFTPYKERAPYIPEYEESQHFTPYKERAPYIPEYEETQKATPSQKAQEYESNFITEYKREVENAKKRWQDKWDSFVGHYNGRGKEILAQIKCNGISSESIRNISVSYPDKVKKELDKLKLTNEEWEEIVSQLNKHKFVAYGILGIDRIAEGKNPDILWRRK